MSVPGFTAEASLYRTGRGYRGFRGAARNSPIYSVAPQYIWRGSCFEKCLMNNYDDPYADHNCNCICYGHPGRTCFLI
jgi:hypothetical protein